MVRMSVGTDGEFFVESSDMLTSKDIDIFEELYTRILTAKQQCIVVTQAGRASTEGD